MEMSTFLSLSLSLLRLNRDKLQKGTTHTRIWCPRAPHWMTSTAAHGCRLQLVGPRDDVDSITGTAAVVQWEYVVL